MHTLIPINSPSFLRGESLPNPTDWGAVFWTSPQSAWSTNWPAPAEIDRALELSVAERAHVSDPTTPVVAEGSIRRSGDMCEFTFAGLSVTLRTAKGVDNLLRLIEAGGREIHCLDLVGVEGRIGQQLFSYVAGTVAEETFLSVGPQVRRPVGMAVEARKLLHPCSVHFSVLVARQAISFLEAELMGPVAVTFCTFDLFHEDMLGVVSRIGYARRVRLFIVLFPMAGKACFPGHDHFTVPG